MSGDDQNWNHQIMTLKDPTKPLFTDVSLNGVQSAHLTFECNTCLQRFVWIDHMPYLLTNAKESKGSKPTKTGKTFPITVLSLTGDMQKPNCQPPADLIKRGESPSNPNSSPPITETPTTPSTPSKPAASDATLQFQASVLDVLDKLFEQLQAIKVLLQKGAK